MSTVTKTLRNNLPIFSTIVFAAVLLGAVAIAPAANAYSASSASEGWLDTFNLEACHFSSTEGNDYFFLKPGYQLVLEGEEDGEPVQLTITALDETKTIDGIETRVIKEAETEDGELVEISMNYFALCKETGDIFYFGEITDLYEDGKVVGHEGSWEAGKDNAKAGLVVPGKPEVGVKYYQEMAPGVAEDRTKVVSVNEMLDTPAGKFSDVLKTEETTPLEPGAVEYKYYSAGVGLIQDDTLKLTKYVLPEKDDNAGTVELSPWTQSVDFAGQTVEIGLNSSSKISDFRIDKESKTVTFKVDGAQGTAGTTEIAIGKILKGPYTVTIDGTLANDTSVTETGSSGSEWMKISYTHSSHEIAITGTTVVPEFPLAVVGAIAAIVGIVAIITRTSLLDRES